MLRKGTSISPKNVQNPDNFVNFRTFFHISIKFPAKKVGVSKKNRTFASAFRKRPRVSAADVRHWGMV